MPVAFIFPAGKLHPVIRITLSVLPLHSTMAQGKFSEYNHLVIDLSILLHPVSIATQGCIPPTPRHTSFFKNLRK